MKIEICPTGLVTMSCEEGTDNKELSVSYHSVFGEATLYGAKGNKYFEFCFSGKKEIDNLIEALTIVRQSIIWEEYVYE